MFNFLKKKKKVTTNKVIVLGDSHCRAFSFNSNFFPIFLGAGKEMNFISDKNLKKLKKNITRVLNTFELNESSKLVLFLGEPDTRFYLGKGWYPWDETSKKSSLDFKSNVEASLERYESLIEYILQYNLKPIIMNVTPSRRKDQNQIVAYFNQLLNELSKKKSLNFLDLNDQVFSNDENIIKDDFYLDQVHLSTRLQLIAEKELIKLAVLEKSAFSETSLTNEEIQEKYGYDKRFGCYTLKG